MNSIDRERLVELKQEAKTANPDVLTWYDGMDGAYADCASGGTVSIWLHPPEGSPHIQRLGGSQGPGPVAAELDDIVDDLIDSGDLLYEDPPDDYDQTNGDDSLSELVVPVDVLATNEYMEIGPCGVEFKGTVPFDIWESMTTSIFTLHRAMPWIIGDLLNYGEARYGETYAQAMQITGLSYDALAGYKWIANKIPFAERVAGVPITAYKATATLTTEERAPIIAAYLEEELDTAGVKEAARALKEPPPEEPPQAAPPPPDFDGIIEPDRPEMSAIDPETANVDELPACPICGGRIGKTKCTKCERTFIDLVWRLHDLQGEILGWMETGEYGPLLGAMRKDLTNE